MVRLPFDQDRDLKDQAVFPSEDLWVPVAVVNGNVHILPGVPKLCEFVFLFVCHLFLFLTTFFSLSWFALRELMIIPHSPETPNGSRARAPQASA